MVLTLTEIRGLSNTHEFRYSPHDFRYACMFWESLQRFRYALRTKHWTFWSAITVSHYFCFWTAVVTKFVNAVRVHVYNCLCLYRYFSRFSLQTKHATFFSSIAWLLWLQCSSKILSFYHYLTLPIVGSTFQLTGRQDLIGSSQSVKIFAAALGSWNLLPF